MTDTTRISSVFYRFCTYSWLNSGAGVSCCVKLLPIVSVLATSQLFLYQTAFIVLNRAFQITDSGHAVCRSRAFLARIRRFLETTSKHCKCWMQIAKSNYAIFRRTVFFKISSATRFIVPSFSIFTLHAFCYRFGAVLIQGSGWLCCLGCGRWSGCGGICERCNRWWLTYWIRLFHQCEISSYADKNNNRYYQNYVSKSFLIHMNKYYKLGF